MGTHVNVAHLAAAPMGMTVTFRAEVTGVSDRRVQFRVEAWDEKEKIGEGTHERAIINVAKFATRLAQKKLVTGLRSGRVEAGRKPPNTPPPDSGRAAPVSPAICRR